MWNDVVQFPAVNQHRVELRHKVARKMSHWRSGHFVVQLVRQFYGNGTVAEQWQRVVMNDHIRELVRSLEPSNLDVLEVSGNTWPAEGYFRSYRCASFPEFDICEDSLGQRFDLIIAEQVFEHLLWPYRAGRNVYDMLRPGGHFLISTPFLIPIHECPYDCTRWTPTGLRYFLAECSFALEHVQTFSWGNQCCVKANLKRWQIYSPWWHSRRNEARYPLQVWALAKKQ